MQAKTPFEIVAAYAAGTLEGDDLIFAFNNKLVEREGKDGEIVLTAFGVTYLRDVAPGTPIRVAENAVNWGANSRLTGARAEQQAQANAEVRRMLDAAVPLTVPVFNAFAVQEGGDHYKDFAIQPAEFNERNKLTFLEGCVVKRICRHKRKGGKQDLLKAKHEIDLLIQMYYGV
jgi:hypothetical protein